MKTNKRIENLIQSLRDYFGKKNVDKVIMFGSFARDTASKRSDLDLIVIKNSEQRFFDRYDEFNDLHDVIQVPVDLLIYTPAEWETISSRRFFINVLSEAKIIYVR